MKSDSRFSSYVSDYGENALPVAFLCFFRLKNIFV